MSMTGVDEAYVNGTIKWLLPQGYKWAFDIKTLYNDRGEWILGPFVYSSLDACSDFANEKAPWYPLTKYLWDRCPPKKGVSKN